MAHPKMFDDDDPVLARVRAIALALPQAQEKVSHGRPAFFTRKVFTYYGGSVKVGDDWEQHPRAVLVLVPLDERAALREEECSFVPGYLGPSGWTGLDLDESTDWDEVAELIETSYRETAGARLVRALETDESEPEGRSTPL